jgi:hypothetical protein
MRETFSDRDDMAYLVQAAGRVFSLSINGYQDRGRSDMPDVIRALCPFPEITYRSTAGGT